MKTAMINKEQEIIGTTKTPKGQEKIESISPEILDLPNYDYGNSQNTLDAPIALRNLPSADSGTGTVLVTGAAASYDVVVTGIGFKPKTVIINSNPGISGHAVASWGGATDGDTGDCTYMHDNSNTIFSGTTYQTGKVINLEWQSGGAVYHDIEAELKSMDSDGFTLTVTRNDQSDNFNFQYTCI